MTLPNLPSDDGLIYFIYGLATYSFTIIERIMFQEDNQKIKQNNVLL
jgi:hypothetical protein